MREDYSNLRSVVAVSQISLTWQPVSERLFIAKIRRRYEGLIPFTRCRIFDGLSSQEAFVLPRRMICERPFT